MFRPRLFLKFFGASFALIVLTVVVAGWIAGTRIVAELEEETKVALEKQVSLLHAWAISKLPARPTPEFQVAVEALGKELRTRITVLAADGVVLADSEQDPAGMDNHATRPEVLASKMDRYGRSIRSSDTLDRSMVYVARRIRRDGVFVGTIRGALPLVQIEGRMSTLRSTLLWAGLFALVIGVLVALVIARRVAGPLRSMTKATTAIAASDYKRRVPATGGDEVAELGRAFNDMAARLEAEFAHRERVDAMRTDFFANASHELQTPIASMRGLIETVLNDEDMDPETRRGFLERVKRQGLRLGELVEEMLALARLEAQGRSATPAVTDARDSVQDALDALAPLATEYGVSIDADLGAEALSVRGQAEALRRIAGNLLDNAIKYCSQGGHVLVRVAGLEGNFVLTVRDDGPGIPTNKQDRVFERFYRVDEGRSREAGGSGLGLAIVKHLVQSLQGAIELESDGGSGSTFTVTLPRA